MFILLTILFGCILALLVWADLSNRRRVGFALYFAGVLMLGARLLDFDLSGGEEDFTPWQKERLRRVYGANFSAVPGCYKHGVWLDVAVHYLQLAHELPAVASGTIDPDEYTGVKLEKYREFVKACTLDQYLGGDNPICEEYMIEVDHRVRLLVAGKVNHYLDELTGRCYVDVDDIEEEGAPAIGFRLLIVAVVSACVQVGCWLATVYLCCFAYRHVGFDRQVNQYNVTLTVKTRAYMERVGSVRAVIDVCTLASAWFCCAWLFVSACVVIKICLVLLAASGFCDWRRALHDEIIGTNRVYKPRVVMDKSQRELVKIPKGYWFTDNHRYSLELERLCTEARVLNVYYTDFSRIARAYYNKAAQDNNRYADRMVEEHVFAVCAAVFTRFGEFKDGMKNYNSVIRVLKLVAMSKEQLDELVDFLLTKLRECNCVDAQYRNVYYMLMAVHEFVRVNRVECKMSIEGMEVRNCPVATQFAKTKVLREDKPYFDLLLGRCYINSVYVDKSNDVRYSVIKVDRDHSVIQVYNKDTVNMFGRHKRNCGTVKVRAEYADEVAKFLSKVDSTFAYEAVESGELPHAKSHYLSKVLHMREINKLIDINACGDNLVWDVGTTFCDLVLGAGVVYNLAIVEECDQLRCCNYVKRLDNYMENNCDCGVTIYCGDVVTMDMNAVGISTVLMQNCCYNVDLLDMAYSYMKNSYDKLVTVSQLPRAVVDRQLCDNTTNEMVYFYEYDECQSKLSESNFKVVGLTEGGIYVHNGARLLDWFTYDSLQFGSCYMLKTIDVPKFGYYIQTWCESTIPKCGPQYLLDNDSNCDLLNVVNSNGVVSVVVSTRDRVVNFNDTTFITHSVDTTREAANTHMFRSMITDKGARALTMDLKDIDLSLYDGTAVIYKMVRGGCEQCRAEIGVAMVRGVALGRNNMSMSQFTQLGTLYNAADLHSVLKKLADRDCGLVVRMAGVHYNLSNQDTLVRYCCYDWDEHRWYNDLGAISYELDRCVKVSPSNFMVLVNVVKSSRVAVEGVHTVEDLVNTVDKVGLKKKACDLRRQQRVTIKRPAGNSRITEGFDTYVVPPGPWWTVDVDNSCNGELVQERYTSVVVLDLVAHTYYDPFDAMELRHHELNKRGVQGNLPRYIRGAFEVYDDNNLRAAKVPADLPNNGIAVVNVLDNQYVVDTAVICGYKMTGFAWSDASAVALLSERGGVVG